MSTICIVVLIHSHLNEVVYRILFFELKSLDCFNLLFTIFQFLSSMPRTKDDRVFVISCDEDKSVCKKPFEAGIPVVSAEVLLTGVLQQELNLEEYPFLKLSKSLMNVQWNVFFFFWIPLGCLQ